MDRAHLRQRAVDRLQAFVQPALAGQGETEVRGGDAQGIAVAGLARRRLRRARRAFGVRIAVLDQPAVGDVGQ